MQYPRTDIFDLCGVRDVTFWPPARQEVSREAGGRTQAKELGPALWRASFTTSPASLRKAQEIEAALISLRGSVGSFLAYDVRRPFPAAHADGAFADSGRIMSLFPGNAFLIQLDNLAPGLMLTPGDYLGFEFGARPSRGLHMIMAADSGSLMVDGTGKTGVLEVYPPLTPGATVSTSVTLKRAPCEMKLEPQQSPPTINDLATSTVSFSCGQIF